MTKTKLLFVEDDAAFLYIVKNSFELNGKYEIQTASNGQEGLEMYSSFNPDVIVSDIKMPILDGMEMLRKIRDRNESIPFLLVTEQTNVNNLLRGYELHADNFIKKPYIPEELDAHIQAILRRVKNSSNLDEGKEIVHIGGYIFNMDMQTLKYQTTVYNLTDRENRILEKMYKQRGKLIVRKNLLEELWGKSDFFTSRSLDVFIYRLRHYLLNDSKIKITTIRKNGFVLIIS
jgi:DNA-binding response OmpR family regulator